METTKWNILEELKTEEDIKGFVEAAVEEAKNDADIRPLVHCLGIAAKARSLLADCECSFESEGDPCVSAFDKAARSVGYHLTLAPLHNRAAVNT